ncbi:MAG: DmsC/YnfH family molybdoenzyme membrane anchor subunit [Pseudomonadota bacterium]
MFEQRPKEQAYAYIADVDHPTINKYGKNIETVPDDSELRGKSLNINNDSMIGDNPNRYKQHGFYFSADKCIACHACEAACSEKNDLPSHIAFRSVGYVEGGSYPSYTRLNISMACNHCDDPVCLKGCPTRAYTKFAEYGAVLQDPDICFGCGYCTWVCPYNAPQLDHQQGHVEKCNMCVDRLEVGLKPACVSACLAGALDFGIVETTPENRTQLETQIPGFPNPEITHPNIRFQQTSSLPKEMKRTDTIPIRYERDENDQFKSKVDKKSHQKKWSFKKLSTRENPLIIFTLISQLVIGVFLILYLSPKFGLSIFSANANPVLWTLFLFSLIGTQTFALVLSTMHLGKPHRFYRAFNNLRYSPVSREVAGIAVFYNFLGIYTVLTGLPSLFRWMPEIITSILISVTGWGAAFSGVIALYFMHSIYRIPARPYWNHWYVLTSFYGNMITLGSVLVASVYVIYQATQGQPFNQILSILSLFAAFGVMLEIFGLYWHVQYLKTHNGESAASHHEQTTTYGKSYLLRNLGLGISVILLLAVSLYGLHESFGVFVWLVISSIAFLTAILSRSIFYALVIPTTMPGAFFWKNPGFEEHARETRLAERTEAGVLTNIH